jgi:sulfopyruvate decarboxylase subunit alpha
VLGSKWVDTRSVPGPWPIARRQVRGRATGIPTIRGSQDFAEQTAHQEEEEAMAEQQQAAILRPETMVDEFKKNRVTHVVTIPDSETNYLYELMQRQPWLDVVPASREGETFAIALGLSIGGKVPVVLIQNTGMMESGDSIRGMALDAGFPLVMVVGYRGWTRHGVITDTAARYTEPFLNAFRINYYLLEQDSDGPRISLAFEEARATKRPVAVLVGDEYHGFNR